MMKKKKNQEARSSSSCAACKFLKRRCTQNCQFAPYFRSEEPKKFAKVHKVFGASNVSKILNEVAEQQREDTVNSLVYEAEVRLRDPVYGCIGAIASLQKKMIELQHDLFLARARLSFFSSSSPNITNSNNNSQQYYYFNDYQFPPSTAAAGGGGGVTATLLDQQYSTLFLDHNSILPNQQGFISDFGQLPFL